MNKMKKKQPFNNIYLLNDQPSEKHYLYKVSFALANSYGLEVLLFEFFFEGCRNFTEK